ncbi:MAG: hypothetical protein D6731_22200 [Planctomycetota bacterium]|nr:MAG: hypothetical protein D6731_22200 [Planctomycetota bacterium]
MKIRKQFAAGAGVGACCALLLLSGLAQAGPFDRVVTTGHDAVATPGARVPLEGKFERRGLWLFNPDLHDEPVDFFLGGTAVGAARTDRDGVAAVPFVAPAAGVYPFAARLARRPSAPPARARLFVLDPAQPVAVCDIDETLSDMPSWQVPFAGALAPTYPGAVALLRDLARRYAIVYLTARDDAFDRSTRAFLARHGFPDGPVLYNDLGWTTRREREQLLSRHHGEFKLRVLRALQGRGVRLVLGLGNAETDAYAYERAGLQSFLRTSRVGSGSSFRFLDYDVLRLELVARGLLP